MSENSDLPIKILETKRETEQLKNQLQNLIDQGRTKICPSKINPSSSTNLNQKPKNSNKEQIIKSYEAQPRNKTEEKHSSQNQKHYNVKEAREYMKKQKGKHLIQQKQTQEEQKIKNEIIKKNLEELNKKSRELVVKNVFKKNKSQSKDVFFQPDTFVNFPQKAKSMDDIRGASKGIIKKNSKCTEFPIKPKEKIVVFSKNCTQSKSKDVPSTVDVELVETERSKSSILDKNIPSIITTPASPIIETKEKDYPQWLNEQIPQVYPFNFINTTRRKLQAAIMQRKTAEIGVQNSEFKLLSEGVINKENMNKSDYKSMILSTKITESESESDTTKNIPEISSESGTSLKKNVECVKRALEFKNYSISTDKIDNMKLVTNSDVNNKTVELPSVSLNIDCDSFDPDISLDLERSRRSIISFNKSNYDEDNSTINTSMLLSNDDVESVSKKLSSDFQKQDRKLNTIQNGVKADKITSTMNSQSERGPSNSFIASSIHTRTSDDNERSIVFSNIKTEQNETSNQLKNVCVRSTKLTTHANETNKLHLKFEAEIHLINDFNNSLKKFSELEQALETLKTNSNIHDKAQSTKTSLNKVQSSSKSTLLDTSKVNFTRGSDSGSRLFDDSDILSNKVFNHESVNSTDLDISNSLPQNLTVKEIDDYFSQRENIQPFNLAGISISMFDQLIKAEDARLENLKTIVKIRERALMDRTKAELAWLEIQRKHFKETGQLHEASSIKKKQRGILVTFDKEKNEMQRLKQSQKTASLQRKIVLKEHRNMIRKQLSTNNMLTKIKVNSSREKRTSGPLRVLQSHTESVKSETSVSIKNSGEKDGNVSVTSHRSVISEISEVEITNDVFGNDRHRLIERELSMREAALKKRRKAAEQLLDWHKKLLEEEKKITLLESSARAIISQKPDSSNSTEKHRFNGKQLNQMWFYPTDANIKKFSDDNIYNMPQISLDRLCMSARDFNKTSKGKKDDVSEKEYVSDFEIESSVTNPDVDQSINLFINNFNKIQEGISSLNINHKQSIEEELKDESHSGNMVSFSETKTDAIKETSSVNEFENSLIIVEESEEKQFKNSIKEKEQVFKDVLSSIVTDTSMPSHEEEMNVPISFDESIKSKEDLLKSLIDEPLISRKKTLTDTSLKENTDSLVKSEKIYKKSSKASIELSSFINKDLSEKEDSFLTESDSIAKIYSEKCSVSLLKSDKISNASSMTSNVSSKDKSLEEIQLIEDNIKESSQENEVNTEISEVQNIEQNPKSIVILQNITLNKNDNLNKFKENQEDVKSEKCYPTIEIVEGLNESQEILDILGENELKLQLNEDISDVQIIDNINASKEILTNLNLLPIANIEEKDHINKSVLELYEIIQATDNSKGNLDMEAKDVLIDLTILEQSESEYLPKTNNTNTSQNLEELNPLEENGESSSDVLNQMFIKKLVASNVEINAQQELLEDSDESKLALSDKSNESFVINDFNDEFNCRSVELPDKIIIIVKDAVEECEEKTVNAETDTIAIQSKEETNSFEEKEHDSLSSANGASSSEALNLQEQSVSTSSDIITENMQSDSSLANKNSVLTKEIIIDARKNVSETRKLKNLNVTSYDLISPTSFSEKDTSSPRSRHKSVSKSFDSEAEELLKKQLAVEEEIKAIKEQQQKEQLLYIREIPNKPPPPYMPPSSLVQIPTIVPTSEEIEEITMYSAKILHKAYISNNLANVNMSNNTLSLISKDISKDCYKFVFDLCKEIAREHYKQFEDDGSPSWLRASKTNEFSLVKPFDIDGLRNHMRHRLKDIFGYQKNYKRENSIIKWGGKKRDHVDEILVKECQQEESQFTNYQKDELFVKNQITNEIFDDLLTDTALTLKKIFLKLKH